MIQEPDSFTVRNWKIFQHYRDRNPPWIKLHYELLSSRDWVMLDDASRVLAVACMLIASRNEGKVPNDPDYICRVAYLKRCNFKPLIAVGFLEDASGCLQVLADARPETETETETDNDHFSDFWTAYPRKVAKPQAEKAWRRLKPADQQAILAALPSWPFSDDKKFCPHPASWLNARRWEDDPGDPRINGHDNPFARFVP